MFWVSSKEASVCCPLPCIPLNKWAGQLINTAPRESKTQCWFQVSSSMDLFCPEDKMILSVSIVLCWIVLILFLCPGRLILWLLALTLILLKYVSANNHFETWIVKRALFDSRKSQCVRHRPQGSLVLGTAEISSHSLDFNGQNVCVRAGTIPIYSSSHWNVLKVTNYEFIIRSLLHSVIQSVWLGKTWTKF